MKTKLVNRYYCDFCKKANCSAASIRKHEAGCTANPNRKCGMCRIMGRTQPTMEALIEAARKDAKASKDSDNGVSLDVLDEVSQGCPACIMAAIRQVKIDAHFQFDFAGETKAFWDAYNKENDCAKW